MSLSLMLFAGAGLAADPAEGEEDKEGADMVMTQQEAIIAD